MHKRKKVRIFKDQISPLKKQFAILLLAVHCMSTSGYLAVFPLLHNDISARISNQLDKGLYSDDELVEIRIPFHSPYTLYQEYTRVDGEIEMNGIHYSYVKRKIYNDTLYMLCIPNLEITQLAALRNNCLQGISGTAASLPDGKTTLPGTILKKAITAEYHSLVMAFHLQGPAPLPAPAYLPADAWFTSRCLPTPFQPPRS